MSYTVSKFGVIGMMRQIAVDYGAYDIRANAIQPAGVGGTNMGRHAAEDRERSGSTAPPDRMPRPRPWMPIRRAGHSRDEYGATVAFLMSDDAGFITGAQLPVDGGYLST
ncbi:MAG: SDR family oxidoreductase [Acidimicrobiales bacterium]|nr:SDR family oxidoreductase [Acidimicrobiales bacterium]